MSEISTTETSISSTSDEEFKNLMNINYTYPSPSDPNLQGKIYQKREFYYHKIPQRPEIQNYQDIKEFRDNVCARKFALQEHQSFLSNFINPDTPYRGILIFHGTGTGKCILPDEMVYVNGNIYKAYELWEQFNNGEIVLDDSNGNWSKPNKDLVINSFNETTKKMETTKISKLYREHVKTPIKKITFENGQEIKLTYSHKLLTDKGWTNSLKEGDCVSIPNVLYNNKSEFNVTKDLAKFIAWQISEGHERKSEISISQYNNDNMQNHVFNLLIDSFNNIKDTYNLKGTVKKVNWDDNVIMIYSCEYRKLLEKNGYTWGNLSKDKLIPDFIMNSTEDIQKIFIGNYFDGDGHVNERDGIVEFTSASNVLIQQFYHMMKNLKIQSRIRKVKKMATNGKQIYRDYWNLYISGKSLRKFNEIITVNFTHKKESLKKICERPSNTNFDVYPVGDILNKAKEISNLPYRYIAHHSYIKTSKNPSKTKLLEIISTMKDSEKYVRTRLNEFKQCITELELYANSDLSYTKIKKIEIIQHNGYVYDFEVPVHHNYVAGGIICHNTCASIAIAEKFKDMVQKYGTKIYVLVSGPLIKENWKGELLKCTAETYLKYQDKTVYMDEHEKNKARKNALNLALQYYRFMSYRSFYKKVLGEKIVDKRTNKGAKMRVSYRKTDKGEFERDIAVDRIYNLNNSVIIVDEAHNLTGNAYGEALLKIIKASNNLRLILLTATPMKNLADDIIELINFIRPPLHPMQRDHVFSSHKNHEMEFKDSGLKYLSEMTRGYVSYLRGADPLTFAKRVEMGTKPDGLLFTKVVQCKMYPFQRKIYNEAIEDKDDTLDRRSEAVANFAFPGLNDDKKTIQGYYGRSGIVTVKNQLKSYYEILNKKIGSEILKGVDVELDTDLLYLSENNKTISGSILKLKYLKYFSIKFYKALKKINRLVWGKKGAKIAFVYSNLVKVGIELFQEVLMQNGYLEYQENPNNYTIGANTVCYYCGRTYKNHQQDKLKKNSQLTRESNKSAPDDNSSSEYVKPKGEMPSHTFYPATYISVTGKSSEESAELIPEDKQRTLEAVFNGIENKEGKYIKLVLGSKVMNEGISLANVAEVHILDVYFNLGKVDQVIGRSIRHCSHYKVTNDDNKYPEVKVYKYSVTIENGLSSEEELYKKAELKYLLIKKVERALKESAIDCPLNRHGNIFPEELRQFKNCGDEGEDACPAICDYMKCEFKCYDAILNNKFYDPDRDIYRKIPMDKLDVSTFTHSLARNEIENTKKKIKELYKTKYAYTLDHILDYVKKTYDDEKRDLFDEFFVYKALDELIPITENDFNNFKDTILDKFNRPGYLIYIDKYYIFQPFNQNDDVPMYYRTTYNKPLINKLSLYNYLKNTIEYKKYKGTKIKKKQESTKNLFKDNLNAYNFDATIEYYDNRNEYKFVGIVDKEASRRKSKHPDEMKDVFKIREMRNKILEKKRGTGIPSLKGAVCATSKSKEYLEEIAVDLKVKLVDNDTRTGICDSIKNKLLELEKYSTGKSKLTYIMIPSDHPLYKFPYNLEDRVEHIKNEIYDKIKFKIDFSVDKIKHKAGQYKDKSYYVISIKNTNKLVDFTEMLHNLGAKLEKEKWTILVD